MTTLPRFIKKMTLVVGLAIGIQANAAIYQEVEIKDVNVKNQGTVATVAPGETFGVRAHYEFLTPLCNGAIIQILVGYSGIGAQTCIANALIWEGDFYDHHPLYFREHWQSVKSKTVDFAMVAPDQAGVYEIRFRNAMAYLPDEAITYWWTATEGNPPEQATIATIIVE